MHKTRWLAQVATLHTLGPKGTNCEAAANDWFHRRKREGSVVLHPTLEAAVPHVLPDRASALLGCIAYPDLHTLMFSNIDRLVLVDCFVMHTFNMVLASRDGAMPRSVATHPAPQSFLDERFDKKFVDSNAAAALSCRNGEADGCITTAPAATLQGLRVVQDFGPIAMGFSVHVPASRPFPPPHR